MKTYLKYSLLISILAACLFLTACTAPATPTPQLTPVTIQLRYGHIATYAGFYAADLQGFYAQEGIQVNFLTAGSTTDIFAPVIAGKAQIGIAGADGLIVEQAAGQDLVAFATILRRSPLVFMSLADSGITRPQDFVGKTIHVSLNSQTVFQALMARVGITPDQYKRVILANGDMASFYERKVDVMGGFISNQAITAKNAGYQLNAIFPDDYGIHFYADTLYATGSTIQQNPDLILRFLRATIKGWEFAIQNPAGAGEMVKHYDPSIDPNRENQVLLALLPMVNTGEDHIGWMRPEIWENMYTTLLEQKVITQPFDISKAYTLKFLNDIYTIAPAGQ